MRIDVGHDDDTLIILGLLNCEGSLELGKSIFNLFRCFLQLVVGFDKEAFDVIVVIFGQGLAKSVLAAHVFSEAVKC